jgi:hypothetical protein
MRITWRAGVAGRALVLGLALSAADEAAAGATATNAAQAEALLQNGKADEALGALDRAVEAFWEASPLQFRTALFANSIAAFGKYEGRPDAAFRSGETALIYLEPVGYGFVREGDLVKIALATGIEIKTPGGLLLGKVDSFGRLEWTGHARSREVHAQIGIELPELKPGDYEMLVTLSDEASGKSATATLPFRIVRP